MAYTYIFTGLNVCFASVLLYYTSCMIITDIIIEYLKYTTTMNVSSSVLCPVPQSGSQYMLLSFFSYLHTCTQKEWSVTVPSCN